LGQVDCNLHFALSFEWTSRKGIDTDVLYL
jgi:hypothetical protein